MKFNKFINSDYLKNNPLCGIGTYKDELNLATGVCTRKIKKYEFNGEEGLQTSGSGNTRFFYMNLADARSWAAVIGDRYVNADISSTSEDIGIAMSGNSQFRIRPDLTSTVSDFKTYLAQQYANGTPVTIWYVLSTPTTETITVPSGLSGTEEGYLNQSGTPTPTNPIYPTANTVEKWFDIPHYIHKTDTDTITTLPTDIYANDTTATAGLKGNMEQTGTPSPSSPIQPSECGERTNNLFDVSTATLGKYIDSNGNEATSTASKPIQALNHTDYIEIQPNTNYTYHYKYSSGVINTIALCWFDASKNLISRNTKNVYEQDKEYTLTGTSPANAAFCIINFVGYLPNASMELSFNLGSTALPYEPYGVKIPILNNSQTTNVYLGEVQTTRQIRKVVLTGEETYVSNSKNNDKSIFQVYMNLSPEGSRQPQDVICTHLPTEESAAWTSQRQGITMRSSAGGIIFGVAFDVIGTTTSETAAQANTKLKEWLAAQYTAGTPVCVWYILAEPETAVVNEPLRKIGDYADEVSGISIPTIAGANTLSVDTTLQPSEVSVNYKGWHPVADVHERDNGAWT